MEYLEPAEREPGLLLEIECLLRDRVWIVPLTRHRRDGEWAQKLYERVSMIPPEWVSSEVLTLTHGDCTTSNAMRRENGKLVLADPFPARPHVARYPEVDMGRMLQSALGWETVVHFEEEVKWEPPVFWSTPLLRNRALWWGTVTARRLLHTETNRKPPRAEVLEWCKWAEGRCWDAIRI